MKAFKRILSVALALALVIGLMPARNAEAADTKTVTLLETSDLHGMLMNYDYAADTVTDKGFVKVASVVKAERAADPDLILVDDGDTTQGNLISDFRTWDIHPAIEALNFLDYDVWELGNHEFNFEFDVLEKEIADFNGTVLAGNIYKADGTRWQTPYVVKDVDGVKVAIIGIDAPNIPVWEAEEEHYNGMTFTQPIDEIGKILDEIDANEKVDATVVLVHNGEDEEHNTVGMYDVAKKYADRVDAFLIGHSHSVFEKYLVNGEWQDEASDKASTVILSTGTLGQYVGKCTLTLEPDGSSYKVTGRTVENILTSTYENDPDTEKMLQKIHKASLDAANEVLGQISADFIDEIEWLPGIPTAFIQDTALVDLINIVQMKEAGADVSMAALFTTSANLLKGDYRLKDGVNVYKYDNTLYGVKCTGKQLKAIMEQQAGNFFNTFREGDVTISFNENMRTYLYDMFAGVDYKIDISKPEGQRIVDVMYKGAPLKDDQELVLAVNNYRFSGLCAAGLLNEEDAVYSSLATAPIPAVREMISEYIRQSGGIEPVCDNNWEIIGYDFSDPQADLIYEKIRLGEIAIPTSPDGRTMNIAAVNANDLRAAGVLPALEGDGGATLPQSGTAAPAVFYAIGALLLAGGAVICTKNRKEEA